MHHINTYLIYLRSNPNKNITSGHEALAAFFGTSLLYPSRIIIHVIQALCEAHKIQYQVPIVVTMVLKTSTIRRWSHFLRSSIIISHPVLLLSILLSLCPLATGFALENKPYLAPHEQRVFNALENVNHDFQAFKQTFATNSHCELNFNDANGNIVTKSGTFDQVFSYLKAIKEYKIKWEPITNSHADHPDLGVLAIKYHHYALTEHGCEALYSGIGTLKVRPALKGIIEFYFEVRTSHCLQGYDFPSCTSMYAVQQRWLRH